MKRLTCWILMMAMLLTAMPVRAAGNVRTSGLYTYEIKGNGTITITDFDWKANGDADIYIPNMIDGYTVTAIGNEAFRCNEVRRTSQHSKYDYNNFATVSLTLPNGIKSIGEKAFWNATLSEINLPDSIQYIGYGAFVGNPTLDFKLSNTHPYYAVINGGLYNKSSKELLAYPYFNEEYRQYEKDSYVIPEGILSIGDYAFYRDIDSESAASRAEDYFIDGMKITFASTIQRIGDYAFYGFKFYGIDNASDTENSGGLTKDQCITLTVFGKEQYYRPTMLPMALTSIGQSAFEKSNGYIDGALIIPAGVSIIGDAAFRNSNLMTDSNGSYIFISADSSLEGIGDEVFRACWDTIVVEADNISFVEDYAFCGTQSVSWLHLESIDTWGNYAFGSDTGSSLDLSNHSHFGDIEYSLSPQLTEIPSGFNLSDVILPDTVKMISENAFTLKVRDYYLPKGLTNIDVDAFPRGSTFIVEAGSYAELWCSENGYGYSIEGQQDDLSWLN